MQKLLQIIRNKFHPLWYLRKLKTYRYLQRKLDFNIFIHMPGISTKVAIRALRDISWILNRNFEPEINQAFRLVLTHLQPATFYDVGANLGFYSWLLREHQPLMNVVLFEPDPTNYQLLQHTIHRNQLTNCKVINAAVSDKLGRMNFVVDEASGATGSLEIIADSDYTSTLHEHYGMIGSRITCEVVTIDSMLTQLPAPELIKIDVEGAEHLVLSGATHCLDLYKPTLIVETKNEDLLGRLHQQGYTIFQIDLGNVLLIDQTRAEAIKEFGTIFTPLKTLIFKGQEQETIRSERPVHSQK